MKSPLLIKVSHILYRDGSLEKSKKRVTILEKVSLGGSSAYRFKLNLFIFFYMAQRQHENRFFYDSVSKWSARLNLNSAP